jgi:hypothetical protein
VLFAIITTPPNSVKQKNTTKAGTIVVVWCTLSEKRILIMVDDIYTQQLLCVVLRFETQDTHACNKVKSNII